MADLVGNDRDEEPPELMEEEEVFHAMQYGYQSTIYLRVKVSNHVIRVAPLQWAYVELELVPSQIEWGPALAQMNQDWVVSPVQELRISRQLLWNEGMRQDLTRHPYVQQHSEICVYCCTPSPWGSIGLYITNISDQEESVFELLRPVDRIFLLHCYHSWDTRWAIPVEPDPEVAAEVLSGEIDYEHEVVPGWGGTGEDGGWGQIPDAEPQ